MEINSYDVNKTWNLTVEALILEALSPLRTAFSSNESSCSRIMALEFFLRKMNYNFMKHLLTIAVRALVGILKLGGPDLYFAKGSI